MAVLGEITMSDMGNLWNEETWRELANMVARFLPQLGASLLIFLVFYVVALGVRRVVRRVSESRRINADVIYVLGKATSLTILALGLVTALGTMGVNVGGLVAGLGLTGFALGFALKEIISNALSGLLLLTYKPFNRNDRIMVAALEGVVTQIDLRYTTLQMPDRRILIPNANLFVNPITVYQSTSPAIENQSLSAS